MVVEDKSRHHLVRHNLSAFLLILIFIITFVAILVMHLAIGAVNKKGQSAKERGVQEDLRLHHNAHPAVGKESLRILTRRKKSVVQHIGNETLCRSCLSSKIFIQPFCCSTKVERQPVPGQSISGRLVHSRAAPEWRHCAALLWPRVHVRGVGHCVR